MSTDKTVQQLVNDVLLKNPPCNSDSNTSWRTGTNFNSSNGIGYFENTNPNFPLKSGVILSTGSVMSAKGPNAEPELSDGTDSWAGDTDLDNIIMTNLGITMNSKNATVLEFDFIPLSSNFSFDFVFASEEYGNGQCNFSDAFAFLLTNTVTNNTTNLAILPSTTTPISVATVRDRSYNSLCSDENPDYFGRFNGGSNADNSATNFNGQTALLKATSNLVINQKYHLKLVVADGNDFKYDSAVFIDGESFSIGKSVLGNDVISTSITSPCYGTSYLLDSGLNPGDYTISWSKEGITIPNQNSPKLTITGSGNYAITFKKPGCVALTDEILIEYQPQIITEEPVDLYNCSDSANPNLFDLSLNTDFLKTRLNPLPILDPLVEVTYHNSLVDANNNSNPLPQLYAISQNTETIYARIKVPESNCYITKDFTLSIAQPAVANKPADLINCSPTNTFKFDLNIQEVTILNGLSPIIFSVKYFTNQADATSGENEIQTPKIYSSVDATIFARVENKTNLNCSISITSFNLKVILRPATSSVPSITTCAGYPLPAISNGEYFTKTNGGGTKLTAGTIINSTQTIYIYKNDPITGCSTNKNFKVTIVSDLLASSFENCGPYELPKLDLGKYYTLANGQGDIIPEGTFITTTTKVFAYYKSAFCELKDEFTITINPEIQIADPPNIFECTSYTLPPLPSVPAGSTINYYTDKDGPTGKGSKLNAGAIITARQIIYVYAITPKKCITEKSFEVIIGNLTDIKECRPYTLPPLPIGKYYSEPNGQNEIPAGTVIKETQDIYFYVPTSACTDNFKFNVDIEQPIVDELEPVTLCGPYILPTLTNGEYFTIAGGKGVKLLAGHIISKTQTIYIFKESVSKTCNNDWPFIITVNPIPKIDARGSVDSCDDYELSPLKNGKYYNGSHQNGGTPQLLDPTIKISETQTIYIYADSPFCSDEGSFDITIHKPKVETPADVTSCVAYTLPPLKVGDYYTQSGGPNSIGGNTKLIAGDIISTSTTLYVYADSNTRNNCFNEKYFAITIVPEPIATDVPIAQSTYCDEDGINDGITTIDLTQLNPIVLGNQTSTEFKVEYFASQSDAVLGNNPFLSSNLKTVFAKVTNTLTINQCFDISNPITIVVNKLPEPNPLGGIICYDNTTDALVKTYTIDSGLDAINYDFEWKNETGTIVSTSNSYVATLQGIYTIKATNKATGCSSANIPVSIIASEDAKVTYTIPNEFTNNPSITVITDGFGDYEYQLDNGAFQSNAVFNDVSSGTHTITVRDKNGCGITTVEATIINYPKFFSPNNDGFNDTWKILDLENLQNTNVQIYDRFGKFLTEITPNGNGWDGTFNGQKLPATDYWFIVTYEKDGIQKVFKSHFSLKR